MRKDLLLRSAEAFQRHHKQQLPQRDEIVSLANLDAVSNGEYIENNSSFIRNDKVGEMVANYGEYDTKIESLAQLHTFDTIRSEFAMLSLARAYTDRCIKRGGTWTSGIHIFWWTKRRLIAAEVPDPAPSDFRYSTTSSLERQVELASWSLLMFRLTYISDIGTHAETTDDPIKNLSSIAEQAAVETEVPSKRRLLSWLRRAGTPMLENAMSKDRYTSIARELHKSSNN